MKKTVTLQMPEEFILLCDEYKVKPETILRGFIADLCDIMNYVSEPRLDGYSSNGSDERSIAKEYFHRCGYGK